MHHQSFLPGSTIGILGGGQLGRMIALAAAKLGYRTHIYSPEANCPAAQVTDRFTCANYSDELALSSFAKTVDLVTVEFENIPHQAIAFIENYVPTRPNAKVLQISQHRVREKDFLRYIGVATAGYQHVSSEDDLALFGERTIVLKTLELGYDGKGQRVFANQRTLRDYWQTSSIKQGVLEDFISFEREISVIVARGVDDKMEVFPAAENTHSGGILRTSTAPFLGEIAHQANVIAGHIAEKLGVIGLLAVEFFVTNDQKLLVNEIAPRPHNSGHWTQQGCVTDQFEQCVRAICGLPLGSTRCITPVRMENLIGAEVNRWPEIVTEPNASLHLYGKEDIRDGRKMGHVNWIEA